MSNPYPSKNIHISRRDVLRLGSLAAALSALNACGTLELLPGEDPPTPDSSFSTNPQITPQPADTQPPSQSEPSPSPPSSGYVQTATPSPAQDDLILHTLRRLYFGFTPETLAQVRQIGIDALLDQQLAPEELDNSKVEAVIADLDISKLSTSQLLDQEQQRTSVTEFIFSTLLQQTRSPRQIYEMMVDFWSNHFNIFLADGFNRTLKINDDRDVIRPHALDSFPELLNASAHSPSMLVYLDQAFSRRQSPNENYARELLELHTVGVESGYTHADIQETARVFTGWSLVTPRDQRSEDQIGEFIFRPFAHDNRAKTVMGFEIPADSGQQGGQDLLDYLALHPSTAAFISYKMAVRFIADQPPESIVEHLTQIYQESGGDIKSMLRALVKSPEFAASAGSKLKRPLEFFSSALIASQAEIPLRIRPVRRLAEYLQLSGQLPHMWATPDGYPDQAAWWTTTSGLLYRWNFALQLTSGAFPGLRVPFKRLLADAGSPADLVDLLSTQFLGETLPNDGRDILLSYTGEGELLDQAPHVAALILSSPYFQMR
jgi:uncharacterized protein (DUF1800 family)